MPSRIGITNARVEVNAPAPKPREVTLEHDPKAFKIGDKVVVKKNPHKKVAGWSSNWNSDMDSKTGMTGVILNHTPDSGFIVTMLKDRRTFGFPSCALALVRKKKRVRVGPGPWDEAPCPHLRWNLMAFFREKLSIVKKDGESATCTVRCEKCQTEMVLQAK